MITSNQIISLCERYYSGVRVWGDNFLDIYENPTRSEIQDICILARKSQKGGNPYVRFVANVNSHTIYMWDAFYANHQKVFPFLAVTIKQADAPFMVAGMCRSVGTKLKWEAWDERPSVIVANKNQFYKKFFSYDWSWLGKYMDYKDFFYNLKQFTGLAKKEGT